MGGGQGGGPIDGIAGLVAQAGEAAERAGALAGVLHELADALRAVTVRVRATQDTPWRSVAADAFRDGTSALATSLTRCAEELDGAGASLQAHARAAASRADALADLAGTVERLLAGGLDDLARTARQSLESALPGPWRLT